MKKLLIVAIAMAGVIGTVMVAGAATSILNTCTSTYQLTGAVAVASNWNTAIARVQGAPAIQVAKWAKNLRTGIENADQVNAISGDSVEFRIVWSNSGEATADTIVLSDGLPGGMTMGSITNDTKTGGASGSASIWADKMVATYYTVVGVDPVPASASDGVIRFTVKVN